MKLAVWICFAQGLAAQGVVVTGTVTNAITHEPIAGVTIRVFGSNDAQEISTDASGVFRAQGIEGCCRILFDKEGYAAAGPSNFRWEPAKGGGALNLTMLPWPSVRGRVLDSTGRPVPGSVEAVSSWGRKTVTVDDDGGFLFAQNLSPGNYILIATPATPQAADGTQLAPTYFPHATDRSNAGTVVLRAGDILSGYDILVRRVPVFRVSGRVVDERGEPAAGAVLLVATARAKVTADGDGNFEWPCVRPGNEVVQADWRRGGSLLRGFAPVTMQNHDIDNLTVRVNPPVAVFGTVELDGKPSEVKGNAELEPVTGQGSVGRASIERSGIRFEGIYPGRYRLHVHVSTGFGNSMYLDSVRLSERDITMDEIEIGPGMLAFRVILKTGGGRVRGTVDEGAGGIVVLVPKEERQRLPEFLAVSFFGGGTFQVENVRPGDYYALAVKGSFNLGQMNDPVYAGPRLSGAPAVRVESNGTATVALVYVNDPSVR